MQWFRASDGQLLVQSGQVFTDGHQVFYCDHEGLPVQANGDRLAGELVVKFFLEPDEYFAKFPGEGSKRKWMEQGLGRGCYFMAQAYPGYSCFEGNFYQVEFWEKFDHPKSSRHSIPYTVFVYDGDDASCRRTFDTKELALACWEEVKLLAPFRMPELYEFGFKLD